VFDAFLTLFSRDVIVDEPHWSGPVKGADGNNILDGTHVKALAAVGNATALHLKDAEGFASIVNAERLLVIGRDRGEIEFGFHLPNPLHCLFKNGERPQAEEVHLEHAELCKGIHLELSDDFVVLATAQRDVFIEWPITNDNASRVNACVAT